MTKLRARTKTAAKPRTVGQPLPPRSGEIAELRRCLEQAEAELSFYRSKHAWLISALATQRHARQLLEAGVAASYSDTVSRIREVVSTLIPPQSTLVVVSKGDEELVRFKERKAWHFPQSDDGVYAGHYPANSAEAISHLKALMAKGGEFLLLPNTAFWWLEHYRGLKEWLETSHTELWRDERCAIYKLRHLSSSVAGSVAAVPNSNNASSAEPRSETAAITSNRPVRSDQKTKPERADILCFPIIDWDFRFQRPQQLMGRFAASGHRVFYLSHRFRKTGEPYLLRAIAPRLWEATLRGPRYNTQQGLLDEGCCEFLLRALSDLCTDQSIKEAVTVIQAPFWWPLAKQTATALHGPVVYDCMDHHAGFSSSNPFLLEQERALLSQADLVITSSVWLQRKARGHARNLFLVRNGCDYDHFARAPARPPGARPVIGYYGAIAEWFDSDLVADLAERRQDWDFLLVGSTFCGDISRLSKLPNVSLPGEKPYAEIPTWLAKFDVAILPFKRTPLTEAANPVKAYEIFASGKPLVSVPLPEMALLRRLARLASTVDGFEREIKAELNRKNPDHQSKRRAFARRNTWEKRFQKLSSAMQNFLIKPTSAPHPIKRQPQIPARFV